MSEPTYPALKSTEGKALATILRDLGFPTHRIAMLWDCNQGRVAEAIGTRRKYTDIVIRRVSKNNVEIQTTA